jgi:hypothetical protein
LKTGDVDLVVEAAHLANAREQIGTVFASLGFDHAGRHWTRGDLFARCPRSRWKIPRSWYASDLTSSG